MTRVYAVHDAVAGMEANLATGTAAGLLDSSDHAQSIFKHAIIRRYVLPFLAMTGSTSDEGRAVVMDGFAGRGRYADGTPGSAELIMQAVRGLHGSRTVAAFFAETESILILPLLLRMAFRCSCSLTPVARCCRSCGSLG